MASNSLAAAGIAGKRYAATLRAGWLGPVLHPRITSGFGDVWWKGWRGPDVGRRPPIAPDVLVKTDRFFFKFQR